MAHSKLSWHISGFPSPDVYNWIKQAQPPVVKVFNFNSPDNIKYIKSLVPNALVVYRQYTNLDLNGSADAFYNELTQSEALAKLAGLGLVWEGLNEANLASTADAQKLDAWYVRFAQLMHARGEKVAAFSFSTGNPNTTYAPYLKSSAAACDYIAMHEYLSPQAGDVMIGQYRQFLSALGVAKPVLITETGVDDGRNGGWQKYFPVDKYLSLLSHVDDVYAADPNLIGATIFQFGAGGQWATFAVDSIGSQLASHIQTYQPTPVQIPQPPPPPAPAPAWAKGIDVSHYQGAVNWDQVARSGVSFAFVKGSEGSDIADERFAENWAGAKSSGVLRGAYHYFVNGIDPVLQAQKFLSVLGSDKGELLPAVDVEDTKSVADPNKILQFCQTVKSATSLNPIVYTGKWFWDHAPYWTGRFQWAGGNDLWAADQKDTNSPALPSDWTVWKFWQYAQGNVPGINGAVDLDWFNGTVDDLKAYAHPSVSTPPPSVSFTLDPLEIGQGGSAVLKWDVDGVKAVYLGDRGVVGHDSQQVSPAQTTTYVLHVVLPDNTTNDYPLTLTVAPTTVPSTVPADPRLSAYPRPKDDNGIGLHFRLNLRDDPAHPYITQGVSWLSQIHAKWTLIAGNDWNQILAAAE